MEPWLLFFDIDGTLLDNDTNQVPDSTIKALKKAQAAGHKIFFGAPAGAEYLYQSRWQRLVLTAW